MPAGHAACTLFVLHAWAVPRTSSSWHPAPPRRSCRGLRLTACIISNCASVRCPANRPCICPTPLNAVQGGKVEPGQHLYGSFSWRRGKTSIELSYLSASSLPSGGKSAALSSPAQEHVCYPVRALTYKGASQYMRKMQAISAAVPATTQRSSTCCSGRLVWQLPPSDVLPCPSAKPEALMWSLMQVLTTTLQARLSPSFLAGRSECLRCTDERLHKTDVSKHGRLCGR